MTPALEIARAEYIAAAARPCDRCGSWAGLAMVLPELSPRASAVRIAEAFAKAPLLCRNCSPASGSRPEDGPSVSPYDRTSALRRDRVLSAYSGGAAGQSSQGIQQGEAAVTAYLGGLSPNSRRGMTDALTILAKLLGSESPTAVAWHELRFAQTSALQVRVIATGRNPDYCKKLLSGLKGVLKASKRLGLMTSEQYESAVELERIRGSRIRNVKNLRAGDLGALLASTRDDSQPMRSLRDRAMLALLAGGGLRRAEAAYVTTEHFNRSTRTLLVRGKGDKERMVPLPTWAARALAEFVDARKFDGPLLCPVSQRDEALARPLAGGQAVYVVLHRLADRAGLTQWSPPHAFRREFCRRVLDAGADIFLTQQLLGHSDPKTTATYATRTIERLAVATDRLADPEARLEAY